MWASALNVPLARVGAAARPLRAKHGCFIAVQACKGRDAARAGGSPSVALNDAGADRRERKSDRAFA